MSFPAEIIIKRSKLMHSFGVFIMLLTFSLAVWILMRSPDDFTDRNPIIMYLIGGFLVCVSIYAVIAHIRKMLSNSPGIVLSKDGFTEEKHGIFVPWSDVSEFSEQRLMTSKKWPKVIAVHLKDASKYEKRRLSLKNIYYDDEDRADVRALMISSLFLKIRRQELLELFEQYNTANDTLAAE